MGEKNDTDPKPNDNTDDISKLKAENEELQKKLSELSKPKEDAPKEDDDLRKKAMKEREGKDDSARQTARIEKAVTFNHGLKPFVETHKALLPTSVEDILKAAEKETYDSVVERSDALRSALVQEFFSIEDNVNLLTTSQKKMLEDYLKLTKTSKEQKSEEIYDNLFEPAVETLKKIKRSEELVRARNGYATGNELQDKYKQRLVDISTKAHLNDKQQREIAK